MVRSKGQLPKKRLDVKYTSQPAPEHSDKSVNPYLPAQAEKNKTLKKSRRDAPAQPTLLRLLKAAMTRSSRIRTCKRL